MGKGMRELLRKVAQPAPPVQADPQEAQATASTMSKLTSSQEFQTFIVGKLRQLGKSAAHLSREEYDAIVGEFIDPVAKMFTR